ncbi:MAG: hypothetical protein M1826_006699 [Phylliscum demangeonii]|nr:MAG: hypothetical protein M1826_006699 [Phylliscum demangeonii]
MGADQPFLYEPSHTYAYPHKAYHPHGASEASLSSAPPQPKREGPLIDFNQHPDSYLIFPTGKIDGKPMKRSTRQRVKLVRRSQLLLRILQLLGAIGLLICAICVRNVEDSAGWTLRVPPAIAILHCIYAITHLSRGDGRRPRTPASTASYMLFAAGTDAVLLPFYAFSALLSHAQRGPPRKQGDTQWTSVFASAPAADQKLIHALFLLAIVAGGLHVVSLVLSLYLAHVFRQIAQLPPDMNPLEDNLTSRHSRRTQPSSVSAGRGGEKASKNTSVAAEEPLIAPARTLPFAATRTEGGSSKRNSRADLPSQISLSQSESVRGSRVELTRSAAGRASPTKRTTYAAESSTPSPKRSERSARSERTALVNDNWYTYLRHEDASVDENLARAGSVVSAGSVGRSLKEHDELELQHQNYYRYGQSSDDDDDDDLAAVHNAHPHPHPQPHPHPLAANPATPPPASASARPRPVLGRTSANPTMTMTPTTISPLPPPAKLYGDLKPATPPVMGTSVDLPFARRAAAAAAATANTSAKTSAKTAAPEAGGTRVISNSGADHHPPASGSGKKRDVSGKMAEEGRAGAGMWARLRKVSGR